MSEYERLKAQKEAILQRQWEKLAKRIADVCFGEATQGQIERIYCVLANKERQECPICHGDGIVQSKPAGAGYADDLPEYVPCDCRKVIPLEESR